jgi:Alternative oxidase
MVAAIVRHFKSLSTMQRDGGMMHTFLEEANNERMHLLTFVRMKDPGMLFR